MMSLDNFQKTVRSPMIPYVETLTGDLLPGELVIIRGSVPEDSERPN